MKISHATQNTSLRARRLALYFGFGVVIIAIMHVVFSYFGFLHTDVDSARYMLSALIQSEAAIVALVVTLSLVAVQLAAQAYSARVIEVFSRAPDLWILMGIYGIAIFYGLGVLKMIETANPQLCDTDFIGLSNLEGHIAFFSTSLISLVAIPFLLKCGSTIISARYTYDSLMGLCFIVHPSCFGARKCRFIALFQENSGILYNIKS